MKKGLISLLLVLFSSSVMGWYGSDHDRWDGWNNFDARGVHDGRAYGYGRGRTDMDGNFTMTITANGRANTNMDTDFDGDWNSDYRADSGWGSYSHPLYRGYYSGVVDQNPTAGYEAHRERVEASRAAAAEARQARK